MKHLFLILLLFSVYNSIAQQTTYFKRDRQKTTQDSALYSRTVTGPEAGSNLYLFIEKFITGEVYCTGASTKPNDMVLEGECTEYYLSGKKASIVIYKANRKLKETLYFPNGNVYLVKEYNYLVKDPANPQQVSVEDAIITCNDSTGKALIINGNRWFTAYRQPPNPKFAKSFFGIDGIKANDNYEEGAVKNGKHDGQWKGGEKGTTFAYIENYDNGTFLSGNSTDKFGKQYTYKVAEASAEYPGGVLNFYNYIGRSVKYPADDRRSNVQGKVYATFVIDKDGSLTDFKILRTPSTAMAEETLRVLKESPQWKPAEQHGIPVRQQFTIPVTFTLGNKF
ncbi:energy transducer TonB [Mucilaginibacter boryungensis]|uniref:Energy transducer TonB n=1 Tax=Mucilaginibacter boryungensis TaxID=768480 RepID=A0ABR9XKQ7_9SPHI|nr:energy transducer TonB [Mucilaginibacter boryungensis]MBE9667992.1 energy transducer TonB [Mucilaginibacter boryungensis]